MIIVEAGKIYTLEVLRKTVIGYILKKNEEEVFLHKNEAFYELAEKDKVEVFLYYDSERRLAATMSLPSCTTENPGWAVVEAIIDAGVFVNIGINKGMLISKDFLPYDINLWPEKGDKLFCILKHKGERLTAKIVNNNEAKAFSLAEVINNGDMVKARVMRFNNEGMILYTEALSIIYVHKTQIRDKYRLGVELEVKITRTDERGIHATMIGKKEDMIDEDSNTVLNYLKEHGFVYDNLTPEDILERFNMSKKAFKRAIGHLYKERLVTYENNKYSIKK